MTSLPAAGATGTPSRLGIQGDRVTVGPEPNSVYPRAIVTQDGTLLATYGWSDGVIAKIVTRESKDCGATWSSPVEVISWNATEGKLNNPHLLQKSSGELLCSYRRFLFKDGKLWQINLDISQSSDKGRSWSKLGSIVSESREEIQGEWEPFLREAPDGTLQAYYSHEFSAHDQDIVYRTSADGGRTWSDITTVAGGGIPNERPGMPQVLSLDEGGMHLMMVFESNQGRRFRLWTRTSLDGGKRWADPRLIYDSGQGHAGGPGVVQLPGILLVSFMTNEDQPDQKYDDLRYVDMKVITSGDGGQSWSKSIKVISQAGWGGVTALGKDVAVLGQTYEGTCVMQRFTP